MPPALAELFKSGKGTVIDLSLSPSYRKGHIPERGTPSARD